MRKYLVCAMLLTVMLTTAVAMRSHYAFPVSALLAAWAVTLAHGFAAAVINARALRASTAKFFAWGLGMNGVRVLLLLAVIFTARRLGMAEFRFFVVATLMGYFCFLFSEILHLHVSTVRPGSKS